MLNYEHYSIIVLPDNYSYLTLAWTSPLARSTELRRILDRLDIDITGKSVEISLTEEQFINYLSTEHYNQFATGKVVWNNRGAVICFNQNNE